MQVAMAIKFRDVWLEGFHEEDRGHKKIAGTIATALY